MSRIKASPKPPRGSGCGSCSTLGDLTTVTQSSAGEQLLEGANVTPCAVPAQQGQGFGSGGL